MIIRPFDAGFFLLMAVMIGAIVLLWALLRNQPQQRREVVLLTLCVVNIIGFFVYKGFLSADAQFLQVSGLDKFNWFNELPLQLCNINMFLIPIGILTRRRSLLGFAFFVAPLGALMALVFPDPAFSGYSLWLPRMLGYYLTHMLILICGFSLTTLGFYRPRHHRSASDDCICGVSRGSAAAAHRLPAGKLFLRIRPGYRHQYSEPALEVDTGAVFV